MDRWLPRKPKRKVTEPLGIEGWGEKWNTERKERKKVSTNYTDHPHKNKKRRGGLKKIKTKSGLLNHPLSLPGNHCAARMLPVPLWNRPEERTEGLEWGYMATKRSTRDVKAQRGLGRGQRGERRGKSLVHLQLPSSSDEMRTWRNGKEQGSLAAAIST